MHPKLFPTSCLLFAIIILIHLPASLAAVDEQYLNCGQPFQCASISITSYPFWGGSRSQSCGHPNFELNCQGEAPTITILSRTYRVLAITDAGKTLTVVRDEFWNNDCPQDLYNATLDTAHFTYVPGTENLTLFYGCRTNLNTTSIPNQFACSANGTTGTFGIYSTISLASVDSIISTCNTSVGVQVNQTAALALQGSTTAGVLTTVIDAGVGLEWEANNSLCDRCVNSGGLCGWNSSSSDSFVCYCSDGPYSATCNTSSPTNTGRKTTGRKTMAIVGPIVLIAAAGSISSAACIFLILWFRKKTSSYNSMFFWRKSTAANDNVEAFLKINGSLALKRYTYSSLKKATDSFREKLGQGGYGGVYKAKLLDGRLVAVKLLNETKGTNGEEFINEVASISRTSHVNIVSLLGFCFEGSKRALAYEYMANGSLDKFIRHKKTHEQTNSVLSWNALHKIAVGVARGLEYLHRGCGTRIFHFDIKPHNILLDEEFCPKISDFGLAKLCPNKESNVSMLGARGTVGYIAPEVFSRLFGRVSHKADVYSYGMLVLEMVGVWENTDECVRESSDIYFPDFIYKKLECDGDLRLWGIESLQDEEIARKMIVVGLWCIQSHPSDRPAMSKVIEMLEGNLESLQVPPKPFLFPPLMAIVDSSDKITGLESTTEEQSTTSHQL